MALGLILRLILRREQELETGACREGNRGRPCQMHPQEAQNHVGKGGRQAHQSLAALSKAN